MKKKTKNSKKKYIIIIAIILIILTAIIVAIIRKTNKKEFTTMEDFTSIKEVIEYLGCTYIKEKKSSDKNYDIDAYVKFKVDLYDEDGNSEENFYNRLITMIATVTKYKNVRIFDEEKNITIEIQCDTENGQMERYLINGVEYYFFKEDSKRNLENIKEEKEIDLNIKSNELNEAINNDWITRDVNFGSKDSEFENYDIYFDEGIEVRNTYRKIFNVIFTEKYGKEVIEGIKVGDSIEDVKKKLGEPLFSSDGDSVIGYKSKEIYIFFEKDEISVYRVENEDKTNDINKIISNYMNDQNMNNLITEILDKWEDYDTYVANDEEFSLIYTLRGLEIKINGLDSDGIYLYSNYKYDESDKEKFSNSEDIMFKTENLIEKTENTRYSRKQNLQYKYNDYVDHFEYDKKKSSQYSFMLISEQNAQDKLSFLSKNSDYPNRTIKKDDDVNSYMWMDDFNFVYSIKNKGMYLYDLRDGKEYTILEGNDDFQLKKIENNTIYYDEKNIEIKID